MFHPLQLKFSVGVNLTGYKACKTLSLLPTCMNVINWLSVARLRAINQILHNVYHSGARLAALNFFFANFKFLLSIIIL